MQAMFTWDIEGYLLRKLYTNSPDNLQQYTQMIEDVLCPDPNLYLAEMASGLAHIKEIQAAPRQARRHHAPRHHSLLVQHAKFVKCRCYTPYSCLAQLARQPVCKPHQFRKAEKKPCSTLRELTMSYKVGCHFCQIHPWPPSSKPKPTQSHYLLQGRVLFTQL